MIIIIMNYTLKYLKNYFLKPAHIEKLLEKSKPQNKESVNKLGCRHSKSWSIEGKTFTFKAPTQSLIQTWIFKKKDCT